MRHTFTRHVIVRIAIVLATLAVGTAPAAAREGGEEPGAPVVQAPPHDRGAHDFEPSAKELARIDDFAPGSRERARRGRFPRAPQELGAVRTWPTIDLAHDQFFLQDFTLRALGQRVEVWVANDISFPAGSCWNGTDGTSISDAQVQYLAQEFDTTIYPRLTSTFHRPAPRGGQNAQLDEMLPEIPADGFVGDPGRIVVLVENIRDSQYHGLGPAATEGYASPATSTLTDRHILSIDSAWWNQQLGPRPIEATVPAGCGSARPIAHRFEWVTAHEFTHVLEFDGGWRDQSWLLEGLADWGAFTLGYLSPASTEAFSGNVSLLCFLGSPTCAGGPENSLTQFPEGPTGCRCTDYGAANSFMNVLEIAGGRRFMAALATDSRRGLPGLRALLREFGITSSDQDLMQDWSTMAAIDGVLDDGARLRGAHARRFQAPRLHAQVNLDSRFSHQRPGVPVNGADFVRLRDAAGTPLPVGAIQSIAFDGAPHFDPPPLRWSVDDGALHIEAGPFADEAIVRAVAVSADDPTLTFRTRHDIEHGWDLAVVQVSTDGGATYQSLPATTTTTTADPEADPSITQHLPGFTGDSGGWIEQQVDLSAYAGQTVHLSFRYLTDELVQGSGWWIDDVAVGGATVADGATLEGWHTPEQVRPVPIGGLRLRLVGYDDAHRQAFVHDVPLDGQLDATVTGVQLLAAAGANVETVAAIVSHYEPFDDATRPARYALTVNGVLQPGG